MPNEKEKFDQPDYTTDRKNRVKAYEKIINGENIIVEFFDNNFPEKFTKYYNDIELLQKISNNGYETIKNFYSLEQNNKYMHDMFLQLNDLCK